MNKRRFGARLRRYRQEAGLTMRELAERASISYNYVRSLESGAKGFPATEVVIRLAEVLGVSTDALLGRDMDQHDLTNPRTLFFASHADELTDEEWAVIRSLIEQFTRDE